MGLFGQWGNSGWWVKSSDNHKVHTLFLVSVVSMNWEFSSTASMSRCAGLIEGKALL